MSKGSLWKNAIVGHDRVAPDSLLANPHNFRKHPQRQRRVVADSIAELGFIRSVTVNRRTGNLVDGHERVWQALQTEQPLIDVEYVDLSPEDEKKALAVLDASSTLAELDASLLDDLLGDVTTSSDLLEKLFEDLRSQAGLLDEPMPSDDDVPDGQMDRAMELMEQWGTAEGQLWHVDGQRQHRLLCGDSTQQADVAKLLDGDTPFIMVTDPPYGVDYDPTYRSNNRTGKVTNDDRASWNDAYHLFPGDVAYVWHGNLHVATVFSDLANADLLARSYIMWKKPHFAMGRGHYHWQHEPCWYVVRKGKTSKWCGDRTQSTVWEIAHVHPTLGTTDDGETPHGTQKPIECMARPIRNHGGQNDHVYDPFLGSGTTMVSAEKLNRQCYGMEIAPQYVAVVLQRMTDLGCECRLIDD